MITGFRRYCLYLILLLDLFIIYPPTTTAFGISTLDRVKFPNLLDRTYQKETGCQEAIQELTREGDWLENLIDPILLSQEQISEKIRFYTRVNACLIEDPGLLPGQAETVRQHIHTFLVFVENSDSQPGNFTYMLIDMQNSQDPAIRQLRQEAAIPPPPGYVFMHTYPSLDVMPPIIKRGFINKNVAGITMYSRYIAILADENQSWPELLLDSQTIPRTISHELVHAYVNALLGYDNYRQQPKWWQEGIAIYFSGSGEEHIVVTPNMTITSTSPDEYRYYKLIFEFLENKLGREKLLESIKISVLDSNPAALYAPLGITDETILFLEVDKWQRQVVITRTILLMAGVGAIIGILYWRMPDIRCPNCGHSGKKKEFASGYCPECWSRIDQ